MRVVMRSGASVNVQTVMKRSSIPYFLQIDTTSHPAWTGEREGVSLEDERIIKLMSKFGGFGGFASSPQPESTSEQQQGDGDTGATP